MRRAIVTGAGGLLGTPLCTALLDRGWEVLGVGRHEGPDCLVQRPGMAWRTIDCSREDLAGSDLAGVDTLFHLAAEIRARGADADREFQRVNAAGSLRTFRACAPAVPRLIYASTQMVYGDPNCTSVGERYPFDAEKTAYGLSKWHGEHWLKHFHSRRRHGLAVILRFPGFLESPDCVLRYLLAAATANAPIELYSRGEIRRDYLSVQDGVQALLAAADLPLPTGEADESPRDYNLGSGTGVTAGELAHAVCEALGSASPIVPVAHPAPRLHFVFDIAKARCELGFEPKPLLEAVKALAWKERSRAAQPA